MSGELVDLAWNDPIVSCAMTAPCSDSTMSAALSVVPVLSSTAVRQLVHVEVHSDHQNNGIRNLVQSSVNSIRQRKRKVQTITEDDLRIEVLESDEFLAHNV